MHTTSLDGARLLRAFGIRAGVLALIFGVAGQAPVAIILLLIGVGLFGASVSSVTEVQDWPPPWLPGDAPAEPGPRDW